jgi:hypothetical protein
LIFIIAVASGVPAWWRVPGLNFTEFVGKVRAKPDGAVLLSVTVPLPLDAGARVKVRTGYVTMEPGVMSMVFGSLPMTKSNADEALVVADGEALDVDKVDELEELGVVLVGG